MGSILEEGTESAALQGEQVNGCHRKDAVNDRVDPGKQALFDEEISLAIAEIFERLPIPVGQNLSIAYGSENCHSETLPRFLANLKPLFPIIFITYSNGELSRAINAESIPSISWPIFLCAWYFSCVFALSKMVDGHMKGEERLWNCFHFKSYL